MATLQKQLRTCSKGHQYYKSTDCPTCPICEEERRPRDGFLALLSAPARRAMENHGITSLQKLSTFSEKEIMGFHGFGKASLPVLRQALKKQFLSFKKDKPAIKIAADIDSYIAAFPKDIQKMLRQVRATVKKAAPGAEECISYAMPAFKLDGYVALFSAFKNHIGFYPAPTGNATFKKDLEGYKTGRGSIQFPFDKPMPLQLITKMVKYQLKRNQEKAFLKNKKTKSRGR